MPPFTESCVIYTKSMSEHSTLLQDAEKAGTLSTTWHGIASRGTSIPPGTATRLLSWQSVCSGELAA